MDSDVIGRPADHVRCDGCLFFEPSKEKTGLCRLNPPAAGPESSKPKDPHVVSVPVDYWCGQFWDRTKMFLPKGMRRDP